MEQESNSPSALTFTKFLYPPKTNWTRDEDALLTSVVKEHGAKRWNYIAEFIPGRTGKQCRERWMSHIAPNVRNDQWTEEEVELLIRLQAEFGNKWSKISRYFIDRPPNVVKNKFNCILRRSISSKNKESKKKLVCENISSPEMIEVHSKSQSKNMVITETVHFEYIDEELLFDDAVKEQWETEEF